MPDLVMSFPRPTVKKGINSTDEILGKKTTIAPFFRPTMPYHGMLVNIFMGISHSSV